MTQVFISPFVVQNVTVMFTNNVAGKAGAAIYSSDMKQCTWLGNDFPNLTSTPIFVPMDGYNSPFNYMLA